MRNWATVRRRLGLTPDTPGNDKNPEIRLHYGGRANSVEILPFAQKIPQNPCSAFSGFGAVSTTTFSNKHDQDSVIKLSQTGEDSQGDVYRSQTDQTHIDDLCVCARRYLPGPYNLHGLDHVAGCDLV